MVRARETPSFRPLLDKFENLIELLKGKNYLDGAKIIFGIDALDFQERAGLITSGEEAETCPFPSPTEEVLTISNPQRRVLKTIEELNGKSAPGPACFDSIEFVYKSAGVEPECYYSDKSGQGYIVDGKKITIGVDENDEGEKFFQIPTIGSACEKPIGALENYREKLGYIQPGDWLDIVWGDKSSHAVIFIEWIGEPTRQEARIFDWIGGGYRTYGYHNIYLTENIHPVYFYKNPVLA